MCCAGAPSRPGGFYEGVRCQRASDAIRAAVPRIGRERARDAAKAALSGGFITKAEHEALEGDLQ
ncbi:MAG: hypothetical protein IJG82_05390 [Atopobiaceae bacterium]|nr:hypothetical protein [Atopobiaceae bacterium]